MDEFLKSAVMLGLRGRALSSIVLLGFSLLGASYVAADFSPRQPQAVALDVGLSFLRFSLVLLAISWVQDLVGKEFERKTVIFTFAYPNGRHTYIIGRYLGILVLLASATAVMGGFLAWVVSVSAHDYVQMQPIALGPTFVVTLVGVYLDAAVVAAFALCIAALSTVTLMPLALGGMFAIAGRSLGPVMEYLRQGAEGDAELAANFSPVLDLIQWLVPDLSRLDWRVWPMYQMPIAEETLIWSVVMAMAYISLMLALAIVAVGRRELT